MNNVAPPKFGMGAPVRRKEDKALVTGAGRFTDDYTPEGTLRAVVLRSTMAHARFRLGDLADVQAMPGVRLVLTHSDLGGIGGLPCKANVRQTDGTTQKSPYHPLLCKDVVRHVGDPIAFVVADDLEAARAAAEVDRGRLRADDGGCRHEGRDGAGRSDHLAGIRHQHRLRMFARRKAPHRRGLRQGGQGHPHRDRQQPPRRQLHGDARHRRRIRRRQRTATR